MKKLLKWIGIIIISLISLTLLLVFISSLFSYKETDFDKIPKDFFKTIHQNKDAKSKNNGYNDLKNITNEIAIFHNKNKDFIGYLDTKAKCLFDNMSSYNYCKKIYKPNNIKQNYINLITFNKKIQKDINTLNKKDFIKFNGNFSETLNYASLNKYSRINGYLAYKEFESGNKIGGIQILLNQQKFIDNLINKGDFNLLLSLVIRTQADINFRFINYFLSKNNLNIYHKKLILNVLEKNIKNGLIANGLKWEKKYLEKTILGTTKGVKNLFYSEKETLILLNNIFYDIIKNNGKLTIFPYIEYINPMININLGTLNNFIGRILVSSGITIYRSQFKKETEMHKVRNKLIIDLKQ